MATDNADELQAIQTAYRARAGAPAAPRDVLEGKTGTYTGNGTGAATTFLVTHGLGRTPTQVILTGGTQAASAVNWVTNKTGTQFTINFAVAPATATGNVVFDYLVV